ncbi:MAG: hypothetical protein ACE369_07515 [Roseovarius sp.]
MLRAGATAKVLLICAAAGLGACTTAGVSGDPPRASAQAAIAEVSRRPISFPDYPAPGTTYLSFNKAHGFQVNYIAAGGRAWLWYPGNHMALPEDWRLDTVQGIRAICFRHPRNSRNPVTATRGGDYQCQAIELSQKTIVAKLSGDPFNLRSGEVPYRSSRCTAPDAFSFDRDRYRC